MSSGSIGKSIGAAFDPFGSLASFIQSEILLNFTETKIKNIAKRSNIRNQIKSIQEKYYRESFYWISVESEFDLEGVNDFISEELFNTVSACFNSPGWFAQHHARKTLYATAFIKAKATTQPQKNAVRRYLDVLLAVIEEYYLDEIDNKYLFLCGKSIEEIRKSIDEFMKEHSKAIFTKIEYSNSFACFINNIAPMISVDDPMHYRNNRITFIGREKERQVLRNFCDCDREISWIGVVGAGGVGKSKLLYAFSAEMSSDINWKVIWFNENLLYTALQHEEWYYPDNLLMIFDYASITADQIGCFLHKLERIKKANRPKKIRFVLIERENYATVSKRTILPQWHMCLLGEREQKYCVDRCQYKVNSEQRYLQLSGLDDEQLQLLIEKYAMQKSYCIDKTQINDVISFVHSVERNALIRPLYVLLATDALIEGNDLMHWNIYKLFTYVVEKHKMYWKHNICVDDEQLFKAIVSIMVYATVTGGWNLEVLSAPLEQDSKMLLKQKSRLESIINGLNMDKEGIQGVYPLEPDLIGEFFVLNEFREFIYNSAYFKSLCCEYWKKPEHFVAFLRRMIDDCYSSDLFEEFFTSLFDQMFDYDNENRLLQYVVLLGHITTKEKLFNLRDEVIKRIRSQALQHPENKEINKIYAMALFNISNDLNVEEAVKVIQDLEHMVKSDPSNIDALLFYMDAIINLISRQTKDCARSSTKKLDEIMFVYSNIDHRNQDIVLRYMEGMFNFCNHNVDDCDDELNKICQMAELFPEVGDAFMRSLGCAKIV